MKTAPDRTKARMRIPYVDTATAQLPLRAELVASIERVLDHGRFIGGPEVAALERRLAERCGVRHAVAVGSGTDALLLTLEALGIGPGDEVLTVPNSFITTVSSIALRGATAVLVDVSDDFNLDPDRIEAALSPRTRAILVVHLTGRPAAMDRIDALARKHDLLVIEDAAQAIGASFAGRTVGSLGIAGCFSFHPLKTLHQSFNLSLIP